MAIEVNTIVEIGPTYGGKIGNLILKDAKFFGRPNFAGELNQFRETKRQFTVLIPNELADQLRAMGWNVKTSIPSEDERADGRTDLSHLKVAVDERSSVVKLNNGQAIQELPPENWDVVDRTRFTDMGMEIRGWEYDPEENPGKYSARLVQFVGIMRPNLLEDRYGI